MDTVQWTLFILDTMYLIHSMYYIPYMNQRILEFVLYINMKACQLEAAECVYIPEAN